ncbi:hypothetical protein DSO57_1006708 [Entomophthora muscae]|uniref:Uncharacterized protein n=1 Tax=Entomophthora muscae TaxID=34485 RepID=A0ACC2UH22_9FUNG|nr:hypothetical protein DSO57_1006708 [Entomophthora muscae]
MTYIDNKVATVAVVPPTPPPEDLTQSEAKIWEAITELKATTLPQTSASNPPTAEPVPNPCITILSDQVATLQAEIAYLHQCLSNQYNSSSEARDNGKEETDEVPALNNHGCCPGGNCGDVATKFPSLPANVSYDTQGALNESPLDVSIGMSQTDGNIELQALSPN